MGTYHTFFVATEPDLDGLFPGWKAVKPEQVVKDAVNPFTKERVKVKTWDPVEAPTPLGKPSLYDGEAWGPAVDPVVPVENAYMAGIEDAGAAGLRALPHFRAKNYDVFYDFDALTAALLGAGAVAPPARVGRDEDDDAPIVHALPHAAAEVLASIDDAKLPAIMAEVIANGVGDPDADAAYFVEHALRPLKLLAALALARGGRVCHYYALHY